MRPLYAVVMGAIGLALLAAGCGGAIPSSNGGPATLKMTSSALGRFLVDGRGQSLYLFEKDEGAESYCTSACAAVWPAFETSSKPHAASGVDSAALGTIKRDDGEMQVTYHGHPLYYYAADASTPGKSKGEAATQFGAEWYLVDARGETVEEKTPESKPQSGTGTDGGGGGGYP
jgi:predicted lipoprotein with Yx(FWY)xxD motif